MITIGAALQGLGVAIIALIIVGVFCLMMVLISATVAQIRSDHNKEDK